GVDAGEFGEREDRFLDTVEVGNDFFGETDLRQGLAGHDARGHLGQRLADALGDERYGTRSARVHFDDEDIFALHGHLHVHQTYYTQLQGHGLDLLADLVLDVHGQRVRRQRTGGVARVHASLLDVLHDRADDYLLAITHGIDIDFNGAVEEVVKQYRAVVGHLHGFTHVALELFFLVDDFHRPAAQHIGRTHHHRIANGFGGGQRFV